MATIFYRLRTTRRYFLLLRRLARIGGLAKRPYRRILRAWRDYAHGQQQFLKAWVFDRERLLRHAFFSLSAAVRWNSNDRGLERRVFHQLRSALYRFQYRDMAAREHHDAFLQRRVFYTLFRVLASRYQRCLSHVRRKDAELMAGAFTAWRRRASLHARVAEMDTTYTLARGLAIWRYAFATRSAERFRNHSLAAKALLAMRSKRRALASAELRVLISRGFDPGGAAEVRSGRKSVDSEANDRRACEGMGLRFPTRSISSLAGSPASGRRDPAANTAKHPADTLSPILSETFLTPEVYAFLTLQRSFLAWREQAASRRARREDYSAARGMYRRFLLSRVYRCMVGKYSEIHRRRLAVTHFRVTLQRNARSYYFQRWRDNVLAGKALERRLRFYLSARAEAIQRKVFEAWLSKTDAQRVRNHALRLLEVRVSSRLRGEVLLAWRDRYRLLSAQRTESREFFRQVVIPHQKQEALHAWRERLVQRAEAYAVCIPILRDFFEECDFTDRPTGGWYSHGSAGQLARRAFETWLGKTRRMSSLREIGGEIRDRYIVVLERHALSAMRKTIMGLRLAHAVEAALLKVYGPPVLRFMGRRLAINRVGAAVRAAHAVFLERRALQAWKLAYAENRRLNGAYRQVRSSYEARLEFAALSGLAEARRDAKEVRKYAEILQPVHNRWLAHTALRAWLLALLSRLSAKGSRFLTDRLVEKRNERASIPELIIAVIDLRSHCEGQEEGTGPDVPKGAQDSAPDELVEEVQLGTMESMLESVGPLTRIPAREREEDVCEPLHSSAGATVDSMRNISSHTIQDIDSRISNVCGKLARFCGRGVMACDGE